MKVQTIIRQVLLLIFFLSFSSCGKDNITDEKTPKEAEQEENPVNKDYAVNINPDWIGGKVAFSNGATGAFDALAVKDPSIVYANGLYHLFYTGRDKGAEGSWRTGYTTANSLENLANSDDRTLLTSLNGGSYFCAPQILWFEPQKKWYLIYQSGKGATFSTNTTIGEKQNWTAGESMGFSDGIDFWVVSDSKDSVYCFYSAQDGSRTIKRRSTSIHNFPYGWKYYDVVATETFEAVHVYKNKANNKYYMIVEDIQRHFELWEANHPGGKFTKLAEKWASEDRLMLQDNPWTDQISHGEIIRSGVDEKMEIEDINSCQILIQGVNRGDYGDYGNIPYRLGIIKNHQ